ncbi:MAG: glycerol-3-phosphate 1-O-acyltransferase PlsY [Acaryochloridaceae cyanobacterium CSU_3_4]|nr:glycerol-3-phosphate 1-O-acyltransferase PlsY [Acaryochloridaceae cyanobacterium CSU_3_4]
MMEIILLVIAYFLGSIPTGYLVGRRANIDILKQGSGSTGAANVWRIIGKVEGSFVFTIDFIKGFTAILLMQSVNELKIISKISDISSVMINFQALHEWFVVGAAFLVTLGHSYSCWINFKGGKSAATGLGVLLVLNWMVALGAFGLWLATVVMWRTTSISSMLVAIAIPILMIFTHSPSTYTFITFVLSILVIYRHRSNLDRLRQGTEPKITFFEIEQYEGLSEN